LDRPFSSLQIGVNDGRSWTGVVPIGKETSCRLLTLIMGVRLEVDGVSSEAVDKHTENVGKSYSQTMHAMTDWNHVILHA